MRKIRKGRTRRPCPGCGEINPYREPEKVCSTCRNQLLLVDELKAEIEKIAPDEIRTHIGECPHWNQRIRFDDGLLRKLFHQLVMLAKRHEVERSRYASEGILGKIDLGASIDIIIRKDIADVISTLRIAVESALQAAYQDGKSDGHKLLMRLAAGDISINEFNNKAKGDI